MEKEYPLTVADFARLLAPFGLGRVALAVSGGPDSMAMAWGVKEVLGARNVCAFIVEHGLRAESAQEAQSVQARLKAMGIEAEILTWNHDPVTSRIHVQARDARYALLIAACKEKEREALLLAHHQDDQAETILMRLAKGSGLSGLAGMKAETIREGMRLVRPLLSVAKRQLLMTCEAYNIPFVTDPTNEKQHYARGRLRRVSESLAQEGLTNARLLDLGARAGEAAQAVEHYAQLFLRQNAEVIFGGAIELNSEALSITPRAVVLAAFTMILEALHKKDYPPQRESLVRLFTFLLDENKAGAITLQGCLAQKRKNRVLFLREPSVITDAQNVVAGKTLLWDGRFWVTCPDLGQGHMIKALGFQPRALLDKIAPDLCKKVPSGRLRAGLPCVWQGENIVALPVFSCDFRGLFGLKKG